MAMGAESTLGPLAGSLVRQYVLLSRRQLQRVGPKRSHWSLSSPLRRSMLHDLRYTVPQEHIAVLQRCKVLVMSSEKTCHVSERTSLNFCIFASLLGLEWWVATEPTTVRVRLER